MTRRIAQDQPVKGFGDARPWRKWAKENGLGVNRVWRAISERKLKVHLAGKRMIVLRTATPIFAACLRGRRGSRPPVSKTAAE